MCVCVCVENIVKTFLHSSHHTFVSFFFLTACFVYSQEVIVAGSTLSTRFLFFRLDLLFPHGCPLFDFSCAHHGQSSAQEDTPQPHLFQSLQQLAPSLKSGGTVTMHSIPTSYFGCSFVRDISPDTTICKTELRVSAVFTPPTSL